ncbi:hypothetical protein SDC9_97311 [bioreactor metagenome]|uniref:Transglutaminase-like domain-containing protein n=1 Tax=bioreactor metagenome TaxID=1076179 RepID=A0A645ABI7_9ZZZZ|nr:transglutaminase domain-containing protein [Oscillospiraceae bacterium]
MKEKTKLITIFCIAGVLVIGLSLNTAASILTMKNVDELKALISENMSTDQDVAQENDVVIAGEYEIKSTQKISDAYISHDASALTDKEKETLDMASEILKEIIKEGMTDYEKELAVYDWMTHKLRQDKGILTVIPSTQADCDNPYGVLKYHNAVCVGYATTFRMFMQMMNIECMVVHNSERYHSWDLIKLDGEWYHTDIYSDAETRNYMCFNQNDAMFSDRSWNTDFFPTSTGLKYNYGYQNKSMIDDVHEIASTLKKAIDEKKAYAFIGFNSGITEENAQIAETMLNGISDKISYSDEYNKYTITWKYIPIENNQFILCIYVNGFEQENNGVTEEETQKIQEIINEVFN